MPTGSSKRASEQEYKDFFTQSRGHDIANEQDRKFLHDTYDVTDYELLKEYFDAEDLQLMKSGSYEEFFHKKMREHYGKSGYKWPDDQIFNSVVKTKAKKVELGHLKEFVKDYNGPFVFVELSPKKSGDAWIFKGGKPEKITLNKYKITRVSGQEYIRGSIPVIRDRDIGKCSLCPEYFIVDNQQNSQLHELPPTYCPKCRESRMGEIRYAQKQSRNEEIKQGINPDQIWEIGDCDEFNVQIRDKDNSRRILAKDEYFQEFGRK